MASAVERQVAGKDTVSRNIEVKCRVSNLTEVRAKALAIATTQVELVEQTDTFFVVPAGRLKVREFADGSGELISYDRPDQSGPKESAYTRVSCQDAKVLSQALRSVLPVRGVVVKRREVIIVGRTRIHLDEVRHLGSFLELEVVLRDDEPAEAGEREALRLLETLGIATSSLISGAYIDLLERTTV
jgi:predicted adenylyl cyclase CyaB